MMNSALTLLHLHDAEGIAGRYGTYPDLDPLPLHQPLLWGRQFLNPYALYDHTPRPNLRPSRTPSAPDEPDLNI